MGTNTYFRLVLVFDYCIIGLDKTCNDIFQTGLMKRLWLNQAPHSWGFFGYLTYDYTTSFDIAKHNIGFIGVLPIPMTLSSVI